MHIPVVTLPQLLDTTALRTPSATALIDGEEIVSYKALQSKSNRVAQYLQSLGIESGDHVALMMHNCEEFVASFFGVLRLGAVVTSTCPIYTDSEVSNQWNDGGIRIAIVHARHRPVMQIVRTKCPGLEHVILVGCESSDCSDGFYLEWSAAGTSEVLPTPAIFNADHLACLQYTGGTTGIPKGAMLTHRNIVANAFQLSGPVTIGRNGPEILLGALPFFHIFALTGLIVSGVASGSAIVILPKFELEAAIRAIIRHRPTVFYGVPTMFIALLNHPTLSSNDLRSIRVAISGGGPLPVEVHNRFSNRFPCIRLAEGYGLSETSPVTHVNPVAGQIRVGTIGIPVPLTEAKIVDLDDGQTEQSIGEPGELVVRGPQVMMGYWKRDEESKSVLRNGWFHTGDIGVRDADGYYKIVDRKKDMIKAGGFNVYPREIEEVLFKHPKVSEALVVGVPDPYRGETVKAFIVPRAGEDIDTVDIESHCRTFLAAYKVPRQVEFRSSLPKSNLGKYLRRTLRESSKPSPIEPNTETSPNQSLKINT